MRPEQTGTYICFPILDLPNILERLSKERSLRQMNILGEQLL